MSLVYDHVDENGEYARERMGKWDVASWVQHFEALEPVYVKGWGDATKIFLKAGGTIIDARSCTKIIAALARYFGKSVTALREIMSPCPGMRKLFTPLPLAPHIVLQPLKMRVPRVRKDGATGYAVLAEIVAPRERKGKKTTLLEMKSGAMIEIHGQYGRTYEKITVTRLLAEQYFWRFEAPSAADRPSEPTPSTRPDDQPDPGK
jgi:hypothetical protein